MLTWKDLLANEKEQEYFKKVIEFVNDERRSKVIFPQSKEVFSAFDYCPLEKLRVVILGQDPYHGAGQAHGLSFSVPLGIKPPPSLLNIFKELQADLAVPIPTSGNLTKWAENGVLLLNSVLTVEMGKAGSHANKGWEIFTDKVIASINCNQPHTVFVLWGGYARKKKVLIDQTKHTIIESAHPSPLSAYNGFFGSRPFSRANQALETHQQPPIDWSLS